MLINSRQVKHQSTISVFRRQISIICFQRHSETGSFSKTPRKGSCSCFRLSPFFLYLTTLQGYINSQIFKHKLSINQHRGKRMLLRQGCTQSIRVCAACRASEDQDGGSGSIAIHYHWAQHRDTHIIDRQLRLGKSAYIWEINQLFHFILKCCLLFCCLSFIKKGLLCKNANIKLKAGKYGIGKKKIKST